MKQSQFDNRFIAQTAYEKATRSAVKALEEKGIYDPVLKYWSDFTKMYDEIEAYRIQLSSLIVQFLKMPSGSRPLVPLPASEKTINQWGRPYYE